jgi:hypothetical protein
MTWVFSNLGNWFLRIATYGGTGGCAIPVYALAKFLTSLSPNPWTVPRWSSGNGGSLFSGVSGLTSAAQLNNDRAWIRLAMPGGSGREFCFQHYNSTDDAPWRVKYTPSGGFVNGSETVTQTQGATVECILSPPNNASQGTDASPLFADIMGNPAGGSFGYVSQPVRFFIGADNAAPYGWFLSGVTTYNYVVYGMNQWFCDPLFPGSYSASDPDPYVVSVGYGTAAAGYNWAPTYMRRDDIPMIYSNMGGTLASSSYRHTQCFIIGNTSDYWFVPGGIGSNPFTAKDDLFRVVWGRRQGAGAPSGYKGMSSLFHMNTAPRAYGDTVSLVSTRDKMMMPGGIWIPWDGSYPSI